MPWSDCTAGSASLGVATYQQKPTSSRASAMTVASHRSWSVECRRSPVRWSSVIAPIPSWPMYVSLPSRRQSWARSREASRTGRPAEAIAFSTSAAGILTIALVVDGGARLAQQRAGALAGKRTPTVASSSSVRSCRYAQAPSPSMLTLGARRPGSTAVIPASAPWPRRPRRRRWRRSRRRRSRRRRPASPGRRRP